MGDAKDELHMTPAVLGALLKGDMGNAMVAATPGGIEEQEKQGQTWFQDAGVLPKEVRLDRVGRCTNCGYGKTVERHECTECDGSGRNQSEIEAALEPLGFSFGDSYDQLFRDGRVPDGWHLKPTDHHMWTDVYDANGIVRAQIFYKAAFYDRNAFMNFTPRYMVRREYEDLDDWDSGARFYVFDAKSEEKIFGADFPFLTDTAYGGENCDEYEAQRTSCERWLEETYPEYRDELLYWSD